MCTVLQYYVENRISAYTSLKKKKKYWLSCEKFKFGIQITREKRNITEVDKELI